MSVVVSSTVRPVSQTVVQTGRQQAIRGAKGASGGLEMLEIIGSGAEARGSRSISAPRRRRHDRGDLDSGIAKAVLESGAS